jgi:Fe-S cluster biogenesis protein NfuA
VNAIERSSSQRTDLADFVGEIGLLEAIDETREETSRTVARAYRRSIEALNAAALRRLVRSLKTDPAALSAMKSALADEVVYAVLRHREIVRPALAERVENALESVRPMLASHGGDVELIKVASPSIEVRFTGACDGCPASALTFHAGVKKAVQDACPEITEIQQVKGLGVPANVASDSSVHSRSTPRAAGSSPRLCSTFRRAACGRWSLAARRCCCRDKARSSPASRTLARIRGCHWTPARSPMASSPARITSFQYDLSSGECLTAPEVRLRSHAVRVVGRRVEVRLSS